jgi:outer membrane protein assembly factor BamE (lipoprotein component of BamABCDE complex)|tara:strand:- start:28 stop:495 length:468 start_codon:yes stop_codon:yes gene_type:complete
MSLKSKHIRSYFLIISFIILNGCQLQEPSKNHGIVFLKNRSEKLKINISNTNDVLQIIGQPHTTSINNEDEWIYIERVLIKGEYHKLGQNILKSNNVLVLNFDKYGILKNKTFLNKDDKNKILFSKKKTENNLTQKSFVERILSSIKAKMYSEKK